MSTTALRARDDLLHPLRGHADMRRNLTGAHRLRGLTDHGFARQSRDLRCARGPLVAGLSTAQAVDDGQRVDAAIADACAISYAVSPMRSRISRLRARISSTVMVPRCTAVMLSKYARASAVSQESAAVGRRKPYCAALVLICSRVGCWCVLMRTIVPNVFGNVKCVWQGAVTA